MINELQPVLSSCFTCTNSDCFNFCSIFFLKIFKICLAPTVTDNPYWIPVKKRELIKAVVQFSSRLCPCHICKSIMLQKVCGKS